MCTAHMENKVYDDTMSNAILNFIVFCISFLKMQKKIFKGHGGAMDAVQI